MLLQVSDLAHLTLVRQSLRAHAYWRMSGLRVDLVLLAEKPQPESPDLVPQIAALIATEGPAASVDKPGGIFVRASASIPEADLVLLKSAARIVLDGRDALLAQQLAQRSSNSSTAQTTQTTHRFQVWKKSQPSRSTRRQNRRWLFPMAWGVSRRTGASTSSRPRPSA